MLKVGWLVEIEVCPNNGESGEVFTEMSMLTFANRIKGKKA